MDVNAPEFVPGGLSADAAEFVPWTRYGLQSSGLPLSSEAPEFIPGKLPVPVLSLTSELSCGAEHAVASKGVSPSMQLAQTITPMGPNYTQVACASLWGSEPMEDRWNASARRWAAEDIVSKMTSTTPVARVGLVLGHKSQTVSETASWLPRATEQPSLGAKVALDVLFPNLEKLLPEVGAERDAAAARLLAPATSSEVRSPVAQLPALGAADDFGGDWAAATKSLTSASSRAPPPPPPFSALRCDEDSAGLANNEDWTASGIAESVAAMALGFEDAEDEISDPEGARSDSRGPKPAEAPLPEPPPSAAALSAQQRPQQQPAAAPPRMPAPRAPPALAPEEARQRQPAAAKPPPPAAPPAALAPVGQALRQSGIAAAPRTQGTSSARLPNDPPPAAPPTSHRQAPPPAYAPPPPPLEPPPPPPAELAKGYWEALHAKIGVA